MFEDFNKWEKILILLIIILCILRVVSILWVNGITPDSMFNASFGIDLIEGIPYGEALFSYRPSLLPLFLGGLYLIFGRDVLVLRLLSIFLGIISAVPIYFLSKMLYNRKIAIYSSLIILATPLHWFYSTMFKSEALFILLEILFLYFLFKSDKNRKNLIFSIAILPLLFLTKYTGGIFMIFFLIYLLIYRRSWVKSKYFWLGTLISFLIISPWFAANIGVYGNPFGSALQHLQGTGGLTLELDTTYLIGIPLQSIFFFPFVLIGIYFLYENKGNKLSPLIILTLLIVALMQLVGVKNYRYLIPLVPIFTLFTSLGVYNLENKWQNKIIPILLVLLIFGNIYATYYAFNNHPEVEKYVSLEEAGIFMRKNCKDKKIYTNSGGKFGYISWFTGQREKYYLKSMKNTDYSCVLYYEKNGEIPEKLSDLKLAFHKNKVRVYTPKTKRT